MAIRVLLVEDDVFLGELISEALVRQSVEVTWFVRARKDTDDSRLIFMDVDGRERKLEAYDFDSALVDYRLKCSVLTGPEVVQELSRLGVYIIAASGDASSNKQLKACGAHAAIEKHDLLPNTTRDPHRLRALLVRT